MREKENVRSSPCELLLVLFFLGALLRILFGSGVFGTALQVPDAAPAWIAALLLSDAVMSGSLLAAIVLPAVTFVFGAVSAEIGSAVLALEGGWWRQLLLLLSSVPLHFLLSGWSISTALQLRRFLTGRRQRLLVCGTALWLTVLTASAAGLVLWLTYHGYL